MNEEINNLTVTIRGRCHDEKGNMREVNEVYENVRSAFVNCFATLDDGKIQYDSVVVGGFNTFMLTKVMKAIMNAMDEE